MPSGFFQTMCKTAVPPRAFPPFSGLVRQIAVGGQQLNKARKLMEVIQHGLILLIARALAAIVHIIACHSMYYRKLSRDHRGQRGTTQRSGHVATVKTQSTRCQLVEVRGLDVRMPHETIIRPRLIITQDQDNVRLRQARHRRLLLRVYA